MSLARRKLSCNLQKCPLMVLVLFFICFFTFINLFFSSSFSITGTGGSWCEHFTDEMNKRVDEMIKTEFAGSGFTFYNS